ncbi:UDPGT domain containing protein [Trichuris trichiura]|uniref:UDP-glucuronosyltransferase n=1 Tax=Trichuris trichiura TaxID=36087 RepID=A0A077Z5U4_TRITR|nr:UDPGT domain containing protein [Trichuris trichiura]
MPALTVPSHVKSMLPLARALRKDGHSISLAQYYSQEMEKLSENNVEFIYLSTYGEDFMDEKFDNSVWRVKTAIPWESLMSGWAAGEICRLSWNDDNNTNFYAQLTAGKWDLLIIDNLFQPCGMVLSTASKNLTWVDYSTTHMMKLPRAFRGVQLSPSVDISANADVYEPKRFGSRLMSLLNCIEELAFWVLINTLMETRAEGIPFGKWRVQDFYTNGVYSIGSLPAILDVPLPQTADTFVVDYECPKPAKLSGEYLQFVEDPLSKGTIVLSFGHFADWKAAPAATIQAVSSAFENLQQYRIIWQFNGDLSVVTNRSHVKIESWVPLAAILQHPKTAVFITHTGIKSFLEAVCFATPVVAVPLFGDQPRYSMLASMHGFGVRLDKTNLTKEALYNTIVTVAENRKYKERITKFSGMISDRIIDATSNGKFWINFYLRHPSSANRMRLKGTMLNSFTYSCYDVFTLLCILLFSLRSAIDS